MLLAFCLLLNESRPSLLLKREAAVLQEKLPNASITVLNPDSAPNFRVLVQMTLIRPLRLLLIEPIVMIVATLGSVTCALFYLSAEALLLIFESYGWTPQTASLSFIPIIIGCLCGLFTRLYDYQRLSNRKKSGKPLEPEHKLLGFALAAPSLAAGKICKSLFSPLYFRVTHLAHCSPIQQVKR